MARRWLLLALVVLAIGAILIVRRGQPGQSAVAGQATYGIVTPAQLAGMLPRKDFVFVNVHIPYAGEIDNTDAFIPYNEIDKNLARLPAGKNAKIVLYCRSGRMSTLAAETLVRLGYTNVWNVEGGMGAWETLGLPLKTK
jgi:rhodanese-related sulfurtransferase